MSTDNPVVIGDAVRSTPAVKVHCAKGGQGIYLKSLQSSLISHENACVSFGQQSGPRARGGWGTAAKRLNEIFCISATSKTFQVGKSFRKKGQWRRSFGEGRCCVKSFLWLGEPLARLHIGLTTLESAQTAEVP